MPRCAPLLGRAALDVALDHAQRLRVDVYTVLGQRVATAFDGALRAGAVTEVEVDTRRLAAG